MPLTHSYFHLLKLKGDWMQYVELVSVCFGVILSVVTLADAPSSSSLLDVHTTGCYFAVVVRRGAPLQCCSLLTYTLSR